MTQVLEKLQNIPLDNDVESALYMYLTHVFILYIHIMD